MTYGVTLVKNGVQLCFHFKKTFGSGTAPGPSPQPIRYLKKVKTTLTPDCFLVIFSFLLIHRCLYSVLVLRYSIEEHSAVSLINSPCYRICCSLVAQAKHKCMCQHQRWEHLYQNILFDIIR